MIERRRRAAILRTPQLLAVVVLAVVVAAGAGSAVLLSIPGRVLEPSTQTAGDTAALARARTALIDERRSEIAAALAAVPVGTVRAAIAERDPQLLRSSFAAVPDSGRLTLRVIPERRVRGAAAAPVEAVVRMGSEALVMTDPSVTALPAAGSLAPRHSVRTPAAIAFAAGMALVAATMAAFGAAALTTRRLGRRLNDHVERVGHAFDRFDTAVSEADCGMCLVAPDGQIRLWNPAATRLLETEPADDDADSSDPGRSVSIRSLVELQAGERRMLLPVGEDGECSVVVDIFSTLTRSGDMLHVFRDASRAISIEQVRANFLVTAAHELRTPLTTLAGFIDLLWDERVSAEVARPAIEGAVAQLVQVTEQLEHSALLSRERIVVQPADVRLDTVLGAAQRQCEVGMELDGSCDDVSVWCDPQLLTRALTEILDNAGKYGGRQVVVSACSAGDPRFVDIVVADQGPGIAPESRELVFEPFVRLDADMLSGVGGLGLGLYVTRRIVEAMGGTVTAGHDAQLVLRLPTTAARPTGAMDVAGAVSAPAA